MSSRKEELSDHALKTATWKGGHDECECPKGNRTQGPTRRFNAKEISCPNFGEVTGLRGHHTVCDSESEWVIGAELKLALDNCRLKVEY